MKIFCILKIMYVYHTPTHTSVDQQVDQILDCYPIVTGSTGADCGWPLTPPRWVCVWGVRSAAAKQRLCRMVKM